MVETVAIDLSELDTRFNVIQERIKSFFNTRSFPSVKAQMIKYMNDLSILECDVVSLWSEISITKSCVDADYKKNLRQAYNNASQFDEIPKWRADIVVYGESSVVDAKKIVEILESKCATLDQYKWTFKNHRESANQYYQFLSGESY